MRYLAILLAVATVGCSSGDGKVGVSGTVNWNGAPLENGSITFLEPGVSSESAAVTNGKFTIRTTPGSKNVGVTAYKKISAGDDGRGGAVGIDHQYIPPEFNDNTSLTAEIKDSPDALTFDLEGEAIPDPKPADAQNRRPKDAGNKGGHRESANRRPR